ncbi:MAG: nitrophenyl compound nitroreductase subunit ArsF family protein [Candidatus Omnitrophica bacterium]|nr:nitrophenyl compound nitroreductase subunit ArsF family protein [Candidatus Omnitrophota bacterium]
MKKQFLILMAVATFVSFSIIFSPLAQAGVDTNSPHVVAYYFHGTMRCPTCYKLEQYSKEAIETNFKDSLASGKLEFKVINLEDKGNEHYGKDYQLYTKSFILSLVKDGKETKWQNLNKIWEYVGNNQRFIDYVKSGVADFLKEAK